MKNKHELENIVKGFAHHKRIVLLQMIIKTDNLSLSELSEETNIPFKNTAAHVDKLVLSGLIEKKQDNNFIRLHVTPLGQEVGKFLATI